jgi:aminoacrylate hydrolase
VGRGWRPQTEDLERHFTVVSFDNRGIGASTMSAAMPTIEAMAADALAIMDAEGLDRFHVAGHSMGGLIAQELALAAPDRVSSLSLLCTFSHGREAVSLTPSMALLGLRTRLGSRAMRRNAFLRIVMPDAFLAGVDRAALAAEIGDLFGRDLATSPPIVMQQLKATSRYDPRPRQAALGSIPTMVVCATHDRIARVRFGRALAAGIPGARFVEISDAGHGVPIQKAAEINRLLARHFARGRF